ISAAADAIVDRLRRTPGVFDVADDEYTGQREIRFTLKPGAAALGFTNENVALQVRGALYGIDAHTFAADREDIDVRVRLDEAARRNLGVIENLWVISPTGAAVPLVEIADIEESSSYASIKRLDRRRVVTVTADCAPGLSPEEVMAGFSFEEIQGQFPGVRILTGGRQRNFAEAFGSLPIGFAAALVMIYVILAWLFGSYVQPLAVMTAIPFGVIGVIWGHYLLGIELTFLSLIGFVALSGVVVNDSLILVEYYNHLRREGHPLREALVMAGVRRLRPIFLTTVTTVLGLTPLMLEQSFQARFLIPMAVAISFGLMSATVLILMVLPCLIVIIDDLAAAAHFLWHGETRAARRQREGLPVAPVATE
ncbi:MAG: efflux RND transporter permease subunit, partial [Phycisphaerales bacterium]|nr:efflux RND transporter permease subunit [Phycisphaerales bacterium]